MLYSLSQVQMGIKAIRIADKNSRARLQDKLLNLNSMMNLGQVFQVIRCQNELKAFSGFYSEIRSNLA